MRTGSEGLMLEAMAAVTRAVERLGKQATRDDILTWSRAAYAAAQGSNRAASSGRVRGAA